MQPMVSTVKLTENVLDEMIVASEGLPLRLYRSCSSFARQDSHGGTFAHSTVGVRAIVRHRTPLL